MFFTDVICKLQPAWKEPEASEIVVFSKIFFVILNKYSRLADIELTHRTVYRLIFFILDGIWSHKLEASNPGVVTDDSHHP